MLNKLLNDVQRYDATNSNDSRGVVQDALTPAQADMAVFLLHTFEMEHVFCQQHTHWGAAHYVLRPDCRPASRFGTRA